eukprot:Sdes_comp19600_c0_seq1m11331
MPIYPVTAPFDASHRGCIHVCTFKKIPNSIEIYRTIQRYIHAFPIPCINTGKRYVPRCSVCCIPCSRLHLCLSCVFFGCWDQKHSFEHFSEKNHELAIDILHNHVYCHICKDYTYDSDLERISHEQFSYAS